MYCRFSDRKRMTEGGTAMNSFISLRILLLYFPVLAIFTAFNACSISASETEIREYRGEKLDSHAGFRENSIAGPQKINITAYRLETIFPDGTGRKYSYDDILKMPAEKKVIKIYCVEGWNVKILWEGFPVSSLIPDRFKKKGLYTVKFFSSDGYSTSLTMDYVLARGLILAHHMNGITLPEERGFPLQLVAESKWGYKWIKWLTRIEISTDRNFRGYWESRSYNNNGDVSGPIFEK